ncbi:MAG TPA: FHA domain-containing protein [Myxococcota bacterium]
MSAPPRISTYLVLRSSGQPERAVVWDTLDITVGRLDSQDIVVPDAEVSRKHAVFRRDGERFAVEDLGTGLGTLVNGEPITTRELQHGDVIQIGSLELKFGQTERRIRPADNVCFASVLKGGSLPAAHADVSGRTMLAFDAEDDLLASVPAQPAKDPGRRAVSADGSLEDLDDMDPLGLSCSGTDLGLASAPRDLDREFDEKPDAWAAAAPTQVPLAARPAEAAPASAGSSASLTLTIEGPAAELEALLALVRGKPIQIGALTLRLRDRS